MYINGCIRRVAAESQQFVSSAVISTFPFTSYISILCFQRSLVLELVLYVYTHVDEGGGGVMAARCLGVGDGGGIRLNGLQIGLSNAVFFIYPVIG